MTVKERLHHLVEALPDSELHTAEKFLEYLTVTPRDPLVKALMSAVEDDEPTTVEEDEGAKQAWEEYLRGEGRSLEDLRKELGHG